MRKTNRLERFTYDVSYSGGETMKFMSSDRVQGNKFTFDTLNWKEGSICINPN